MPTQEDCYKDTFGNLWLPIIKDDGGMTLIQLGDAKGYRATHFHPIAKFDPKVPTFGEWLSNNMHWPSFEILSYEDRGLIMESKHAEYQSKFGGSK
jgi:hypothetical protein